MRKIFIFIFLFLISINVYAVSIEKLLELALNSNVDIRASKLIYENSLVQKSTLDGAYAPSFSVSGNMSTSKPESVSNFIQSVTGTLSYSQQVISGTNIGVEGSYQRVNTNVYGIDSTVQDISAFLTVEQSLNPFWAMKGSSGDPIKQVREYEALANYYKYLDTVKSVFINIIQNSVKVLELKKQVDILRNNISLVNIRIDAITGLVKLGEENEVKLTDLRNDKIMYEQELNSYLLQISSTLQTLNMLCSTQLFESNNFSIELGSLSQIDKLFSHIKNTLDGSTNPLEESLNAQLKGNESSLVLQKQTSAPILSLGVKPLWEIDSFNDKTSYSTTFYVGVNFTPLFKALNSRDEKQIENNITGLENNIESQKAYNQILKLGYEEMLKLYKQQKAELTVLVEKEEKELASYKTEYSSGQISMLDYQTINYRLKNHKISLESVELNIWLYELLRILYG